MPIYIYTYIHTYIYMCVCVCVCNNIWAYTVKEIKQFSQRKFFSS